MFRFGFVCLLWVGGTKKTECSIFHTCLPLPKCINAVVYEIFVCILYALLTISTIDDGCFTQNNIHILHKSVFVICPRCCHSVAYEFTVTLASYPNKIWQKSKNADRKNAKNQQRGRTSFHVCGVCAQQPSSETLLPIIIFILVYTHSTDYASVRHWCATIHVYAYAVNA